MGIQHNELSFQLIVEASPTAMILVNEFGEIVYVNRPTENMFYHKKEELIGQKLNIIIPERFHKHHSKLLTEYFKNPEIRKMGENRELYALRKNDSEFPAEIGLTPIVILEKTFVLVAVIDITERRKNEDAFRLYAKKIEEKNRELEQFAYIASHDLREPLNSISSLIDFILQDEKLKENEELITLLNYINQSSERMKALVAGILDYSRLGNNAELLHTDLNSLLSEVLDDLGSLIQKTNSKIIPGQLPTIPVYKTEFRLLFQNLIANAIKYGKKNIPPEVEIKAKRENGTWVFSVKDNGIGIPVDQFDKIFLLFQRLHNRNEYDGIGIGLAHCKKIAELHDGELWVDSEIEKGSTFYFSIPVKN